MSLPNWEVDLNVYGPIAVKGSPNLREPKGYRLRNPFQSDVRIKAINAGVQITATAYASNIQNAKKVTLVFIGTMLDALTLTLDLPLFLSFTPTHSIRGESYSERRIISHTEWHDAFREARLLSLAEPTFLRALGWYRKGVYTEDTLDSFLAFWNAIEIVAGKYHPDNDEAKKGSKSQVWECFKLIWGECPRWPIVPGQNDWIDQNYDLRKDIAHGIQPITLDFIENTINKLPIIRQVAHQFLSTWRSTKLKPQVPADLANQFGYHD